MKSIRKTSVVSSISVSCCLSCPHFFVIEGFHPLATHHHIGDGHLFEGHRLCTKLKNNIEDTIDLEEEVSEHCPLEEA
jgi:hypothetical protein